MEGIAKVGTPICVPTRVSAKQGEGGCSARDAAQMCMVRRRPPASSASRLVRRPAARTCSLAVPPAVQGARLPPAGGTQFPAKAMAHWLELIRFPAWEQALSAVCNLRCVESHPLQRPVPCPATCHPPQGGVDLGRIASLEKDHKPVDTARRGDAVAMKIEVRSRCCGCCGCFVRSCCCGLVWLLCALLLLGAALFRVSLCRKLALAAAGCAPCACHAAELLQRRAG